MLMLRFHVSCDLHASLVAPVEGRGNPTDLFLLQQRNGINGYDTRDTSLHRFKNSNLTLRDGSA